MARTVGLFIFSFGLAAFTGLFVLWLRHPLEQRVAGRFGWPFLYSAAWFGLNLATWDYTILLAGACGFPALVAHLFQTGGVVAFSVAGLTVAAASLWFPYYWLPGAMLCLLFSVAILMAVRTAPSRGANRWFLLGCIVTIPAAMFAGGEWLRLFMRSLPLGLLLVDSYTRRRFLFADLFLKWGAAYLIGLACLSAWFTIVPRTWPVAYQALLMLPLLWATERLIRLATVQVDRRILGRLYSAQDAERLFADALRNAPDEPGVLKTAERELSSLFRADARIHTERPSSGTVCEVPAHPPLWTCVERHKEAPPFFSEDLTLLHSLCRTLALVLDNRRLEASSTRAELKALRAQINPHFLFNALNTVAGLIPSRPEVAERTVEQLSEVFRYTLRRAENEWTTLEEELEFIRAYLDVESARFGERLVVRMMVAPSTLRLRLPSMVVQPLVENALKHGVARSRGPCVVQISAGVEGDRLIIEVRDQGEDAFDPVGEGHGLANVTRRLQGHYGSKASFALNRDNSGHETVARLEIPV